MKWARLGTGLALAGLIGGGAGWLCWVPYQPERMLQAIPRDAIAVTVHRDLDGRQRVLLNNPVTAGALALAAGSAEEFEALVAGTEFQINLRRFGSHELVAAFVPRLGPLALDAWVFTAWLGARSHWLRWTLLLGGSGMPAERLAGGRIYWIMDTDLTDGQGNPMRFSLTFEEGLTIGCLSADPHNIRTAIACYDRNLPSVLSVEPRLMTWLMDAEETDRGWARLPGLAPVRFAVTAIASDHFAARARWEGDWQRLSPRAPLTTPALFGALPFAASTVSRGLVEGAADSVTLAGDVGTLLAELDADGMAVALFGGEYGGRLRGVRIPAGVLAVACPDGPAGTALMHRIVHRLGMRIGVDLAVEPAPGNEPRIYSVAAPEQTIYGGLPPAERAAFCAVDRWLLVASSRVTLQRLLERRDWAPAVAAAGSMDAAWASVDLVRGEKSIRNALAAYWLVQVLGGQGDPNLTRQLGTVRSQLEQWTGLGHLELRAFPENTDLVVELEIGQ